MNGVVPATVTTASAATVSFLLNASALLLTELPGAAELHMFIQVCETGMLRSQVNLSPSGLRLSSISMPPPRRVIEPPFPTVMAFPPEPLKTGVERM